MTKRGRVNIGDTDGNADWILGPERREEEIAIHEHLAKKYTRVNELKAWFSKFGKRVREND